MKRIKVYHLRETFCPRSLLVDDKSPMPDHESFLIPVEDHERVVAELKAEIERLKRERAKYEADCKRIEYFDDLHEKLATQARVIEKLKERLTSWISETHPNDEHLRNMCLMVEERELAAIERGEE